MSRTYRGSVDWIQNAPERWLPNGWELDRLVVPMQGSDDQWQAFLAGLTLWDASELDPDLFLESFPNDSDRNFPTTELIYIGKKGGVLPPDRRLQQRSVQQVRYIGFITDSNDTAGGFGYNTVPPGTDPALIGTFTLDVTYAALAKGLIVWARDDSELDIGDIGDSIGFEGEVAISHCTATWDNWPPDQRVDINNNDIVLQLFFLDTIASGDIEELVPDQYFKATAIVNSILYPDPPSL